MRAALPALCLKCSGVCGGRIIKAVNAKLMQPTCGDKPGKASALMIRDAAMQKLKIKSDADNSEKKTFGFKERWIGDMKEGLFPGDSGIFRMNDDTLALKSNVDGIVTRQPVCGHWFTEKDGSRSLYEYGVLVQTEKMEPK